MDDTKRIALGAHISHHQLGENSYVACYEHGIWLYSYADNGFDVVNEVILTNSESDELQTILKGRDTNGG